MGCWYAIQKYMCAEELNCDTCVMQSDREIVFIGTNTLRVLVYWKMQHLVAKGDISQE